MKFNLSKPCGHCPFRSDITPYISTERAEEICNAVLKEDKTFRCHETLGRIIGNHCAGALILTTKEDAPNQMQQVAERLGLYDRSKLDLESPVYSSHNEMVEAHKRENDEKRHDSKTRAEV